MEKEIQQEKIDRYLGNQLTGDELQSFEREIKANQNLKRKVNLTKDVNERFDDAMFAKKIGEAISPLNAKYIDGDLPKRNLGKYKWLILLILGIIGVGVWLNSNQGTKKKPTEKEVFAMYFEAYTPSLVNRSTEADKKVSEVLGAYEQEDYLKVIPLITELPEETSSNKEWDIILGISYLNTNDNSKAIVIFEGLAKNEVSFIREIGQWYLALAYLKDDKVLNAKSLLTQLANQDSGKYTKLAQEILLQL